MGPSDVFFKGHVGSWQDEGRPCHGDLDGTVVQEAVRRDGDLGAFRIESECISLWG